MNENWIFKSTGMIIKAGLNLQVKNGALGVTENQEVVLFDDNNQVIVRALISQTIFKFSLFFGDSIKVNDQKWYLSFEPPMKTGPLLLGGAIGAFAGGVQHGMKEEVKASKQKREEFKALIGNLQANM